MPKQQPVEVSGVHLVKIGPNVIVNVEVDGKWFEIIREHEEGSFSHICEANGIRSCQAKGRHFSDETQPRG